jgi:hypothetical protein
MHTIHDFALSSFCLLSVIFGLVCVGGRSTLLFFEHRRERFEINLRRAVSTQPGQHRSAHSPSQEFVMNILDFRVNV